MYLLQSMLARMHAAMHAAYALPVQMDSSSRFVKAKRRRSSVSSSMLGCFALPTVSVKGASAAHNSAHARRTDGTLSSTPFLHIFMISSRVDSSKPLRAIAGELRPFKGD
jgi:hypothetical protein